MTNRCYIKNIAINNFRGIKTLYLKDCSNVNLILGNNDIGKTSILEAIMLSVCNDINDVIYLSNMREGFQNRLTTDSFKFMFPFKEHSISINSDATKIP